MTYKLINTLLKKIASNSHTIDSHGNRYKVSCKFDNNLYSLKKYVTPHRPLKCNIAE